MIKIGFDASRLFSGHSGIGLYSRDLLNNLAYYYPDNAYLLYTPKATQNSSTRFFLNSPLFHVVHPKGAQGLRWNSTWLPRTLERQKVQIYHGLNNELPSGLKETQVKTIVTIHDLIFRKFPQFYSFLERKSLHARIRFACAHAGLILTTSESTRNDLIEFYDIEKEQIKVVYPTCGEQFQQEKAPGLINSILRKYGIPQEYLLFVGALVERKNLIALIQAIEILPPDLRLPLVIIGSGSRYKLKLQSYLLRHRLLDKVLFVQPSKEDLPAIYQKAAVFVFPSLYEGFGIPVLEALYSRTPVVVSNTSSLPEVAGPGAFLSDPHKPESICAGILHFLTDSAAREAAIQKGIEHAPKFQGELLAKEMIAVYRRLLQE